MPSLCCAPPAASLKPVITSSNNEHDTVLHAKAYAALSMKPWLGDDTTHVTRYRLYDNRRYGIFVICHQLLHRSKIVIWRSQRIYRHPCCYAWYCLNIKGSHAAARLYQERIGMPMIASFELDEFCCGRYNHVQGAARSCTPLCRCSPCAPYLRWAPCS